MSKKQRKFLPGLSELLDRLSIVTLKRGFLHEHKDAYDQEIQDILHDIDLIINDENLKITAETLRALVVLSQTNLHIWMSESNIRKGVTEGNSLEKTHSFNGIRCTCKNMINKSVGNGRLDFKIDICNDESVKDFMPSDWK